MNSLGDGLKPSPIPNNEIQNKNVYKCYLKINTGDLLIIIREEYIYIQIKTR